MEMTFEQFKKWWVEVRIPRVMKWPNIVAYEINFALDENEPFDGVAAVSFDSRRLPKGSFRRPKEAARVRPLSPRQAEMLSFSPRKLSSYRVPQVVRDE